MGKLKITYKRGFKSDEKEQKVRDEKWEGEKFQKFIKIFSATYGQKNSGI